MAQCTKCEQPAVGNSRYCKQHRAESRANFKQMIQQQSAERDARYAEFDNIWKQAVEAGLAAGNAAQPTPMYVGTPTSFFSNEIDTSKPVYHVPDGVCGFAWVNIKPANHSFVHWLKKQGHIKADARSYYGGVDYYIHDFGQSMERKAAAARAMVKILSQIQGLKVYYRDRMD